MQLVEYGTSSISAVSVLASECLDSFTSAPLCLEYGVISEPTAPTIGGVISELAAPTVGVEQSPIHYVDWDSLEIDGTLDDEGRIHVMNDDQLFALLGLRDEERAKKSVHAAGSSNDVETSGPGVLEGIEGAAIPVDHTVPGELVISYDKNNTCMDRYTKYPSMKEFRLAEDQKVTLSYHTVWHGMEKAKKELYGCWEESFQLLYSWEEEVLKRSPGSVIEIDIKKFRASYEREIPAMPDKSHWPKVKMPFDLGAPLEKRGVGRQRKLRIKGCLENGGKSSANSDGKNKKVIRGLVTCKRCGGKGKGSLGKTTKRTFHLNLRHQKEQPMKLQ
uniref:Uncharacterized protein n=1 Tax=Oryza meridionalis TaxID=40149 RepID=A0A0E0EPJ4_9ORYZ